MPSPNTATVAESILHPGKMRWGIEFLKFGVRDQDHIARLLPGGRYAQMGLADWVVVNCTERARRWEYPWHGKYDMRVLDVIFSQGWLVSRVRDARGLRSR